MHSSLRLFGPVHLLILALIGGVGLGSVLVVRRRPARWSAVRWIFVAVGTLSGCSWYLFRIFGLHDPLRWALPLEMCDASLWMTLLALVWPRQRLLELAYYWGIAGASLALITPYLIAPLFSIPTITFLTGHGVIVAALIFLLGTGRMRPSRGSWWYALLVLNGFAAFDFLFDKLSGTNYMYLLYKPPIRSLFNIMGPWPWYIAAADGLAAVLFFALEIPFSYAGAVRSQVGMSAS